MRHGRLRALFVAATLLLAACACAGSGPTPSDGESGSPTASPSPSPSPAAAESEPQSLDDEYGLGGGYGGSDSGSSGSGDSGGGGGAGATTTVMIMGYDFPDDITVAAGTTVTFMNHDGGAHTVTEGSDGVADADAAFDEEVPAGGTIEVRFDEPGTYNVTCLIHPTMNMVITVEG